MKFVLLGIGAGSLVAALSARVLKGQWVWNRVNGVVAIWAGTGTGRKIVSKCRWSIIGVLLGLAFFCDQGTDLFRALDRAELARVWATSAALLWATNVWYWSRTLLAMDVDGSGNPQAVPPWAAVWLPRILGTAALGMFTGAIVLASIDVKEDAKETLHNWAIASGIVTALFFAFVALRRDATAYVQKKQKKTPVSRLPIVDGVKTIAGLSLGAKRFASILLGIGATFLLFFWLWAELATSLGTIAVILLAASLWVPFWSLLTYVSHRARLPISVCLVAWALLISGARCSDNREIRTVQRSHADTRPSLGEDLEARIGRLPEAPKGQRIPLFLVAAEGGGIRAAYWTGAVLGRLQDVYPTFSEHLIGVSGVSGGSFGAAVFGALLAEDPERLVERARELSCAPVGKYECLSQRIMATDVLAPNMASMLFPDLVQRFLPFKVPNTDRATEFEAAWEQAWSTLVGSDRFAAPFDSVWDTGWTARPALYLNATHVETGKRLIASSVRVEPSTFVDAEDALSTVDDKSGERTIPLSTAAHMSARFPYISPAGRMPRVDCKLRGHVVDGGYFENSGATTVLDVLATLNGMTKVSSETAIKLIDRMQVVVLLIKNSLPEEQRATTDRWANDLAEPPRALLSVRTGRGDYADEAIKTALGQSRLTGCVRRVEIYRPKERRSGPALPLGWVLSRSAQSVLDDQRRARADVIGEMEGVLGGATCPSEDPRNVTRDARETR